MIYTLQVFQHQEQQKQILQQLLLLQVLPSKVTTNCGTCKKEITKPLADYIRSKTKIFYCNRRCFADRESKYDRRIYKKREEFRYKYDKYYYCTRCMKWLLKEKAVWNRTKTTNRPSCPDCHMFLKTKSRNAKFRKETKERRKQD